MCEVGSKFCKYCQCDHPLTEEWWFASRGSFCICKIKSRGYYKANADKIQLYQKAHYKDNIDRITERQKEYNKVNKEKVKDRREQYRALNADKIKNSVKKYQQSHADEINKYQIEYRVTHAEHISARKRKYIQKRMTKDVNFKIRRALRGRLCKAIRGGFKAGSAVRDLGCTVDQLKQHLESKFQEGMTWDNWGTYGWHIDHIIPLSSFDLSDREQLLKACHYTNLQPLWAEENLKKSDKCPPKG
jgi:hypothetical protein